jgi:uncharacterized protein
MSVEVRPLNVLCNLQCKYCYQDPQRHAGATRQQYDLQKMKGAIAAEGHPFTLFGGEPLLLPLRDLEELWSFGYKLYGRNSVQTNGTLITEDHIRLFREFNVHVGFSLDGPGELNDVRWHGDLRKTRESTARSQAALERLCREGFTNAVIITLHRFNATSQRLPILIDWVKRLTTLGVRIIRLHLLESESATVRTTYGLTDEENIAALRAFLDVTKSSKLDIDLFSDMRRLLRGDDRHASCTWSGCDPYTTRAVLGIEGTGQRSNCGRTNKDGIDFSKAGQSGYERYLALYHTPQDVDGCAGCRFFLMCKGQCPGTAIDGDWRNRTEHCAVWKSLLQCIEQEMCAAGQRPLSLSPHRLEIEQEVVGRWAKGRETSIAQLIGLGGEGQGPTPRPMG